MSSLEIRPLTPTIGAEIHGVDFSEPIGDELKSRIEQALLDHHVVFFPQQDIGPDAHVALGRCFGELQTDHPSYLRVLDDAHPEIIVIESAGMGEDGKRPASADRADVWHTDVTWHESPPTGSILHMQEIPDAGGDTLWVDLTAAYEALSAPMKAFLDPLRAVHDVTATIFEYAAAAGTPREATLEYAKRFTTAEHPVVRTHPRTKRKCLFVNRTFTSHILGLHPAESQAILEFLYQHSIQPEFCVRRRWRKHDIGIWDNRCTLHYAVNDYGGAPRRIHRVTILGERPE